MSNNGGEQISIDVVRNIFKGMFNKQHKNKQKNYIISAKTKTTTQWVDQINEKVCQNTKKLKHLEKESHNFAESLQIYLNKKRQTTKEKNKRPEEKINYKKTPKQQILKLIAGTRN